MTEYSAEFEDQIRDLLSNFYDYLKLAENPAAGRLAADASGGERMEAIQAAVLGTIEDLRSESTPRPSARQNRLYRLLKLRYVDELSTTAVLTRLALSERQYYREHQRALQTISRVLWDRYFAGGDEARASLSLAEELDYLSAANRHRVFSPRDELRAAIAATAVLAEQRGIDVALTDGAEALSLNVSQPVFRQCVIVMLNELIGATAKGGRIEVSLGLSEGAPTITFEAAPLLEAGDAVCARLQADGTASELMASLQAELRWEVAVGRIELRFAGAVNKVLIVDDNPDTVSLFRRYLGNQPYQLLAAADEDEALRIAREAKPICIILDIMLPGKDGWQLLQMTKSHPATAEIPVLICSVLAMEELALSLGADGYLQKPPTRDALLAALGQWAG